MISLLLSFALSLPSQIVVNGKWIDTLGPEWHNRKSAPAATPKLTPSVTKSASPATHTATPPTPAAGVSSVATTSALPPTATSRVDRVSDTAYINDTAWLAQIPDSIIVTNLAVRQSEVRDILSALAMQHGINLVIDSSACGPITLNLRNIKLRDVFRWIAQEQNLLIQSSPGVLKIRKRPIPPPPPPVEPPCHVEHKDSLYTLDVQGAPLDHVIRALTKDAGLNIIMEEGCSNPNVQIHLNRLGSRQLLSILADQLGLEVRERQGVYILSRSAKPSASPGGPVSSGLRVWTEQDTLISMEASQASLQDAVSALTRRLPINLVVLGTLQGNVTLKLSKLPFEQILSFLFSGTEYTWWKHDGTWFVGPSSTPSVTNADLIPLSHLRAEEAMGLIPQVIQKNVQLTLVKSHNAIMCLGSREAIDGIRKYIEKIDFPVPQILIEALVVDVDMDRVRNIGVSLNSKKASIGTSSGELFPGFDQTYKLDNGNTLLSGVPGLRDIVSLPKNFYMRVKALEEDKVLKVRSRPQISTLNGSEATITVGQTQYYLLKTETNMQAVSTTTTTTQKFEKIEANVTLTVTPFVTGEGEITCDIVPDFTEPEGSLDASTPPTLNRRVLKSKVRLREGETIILGGLVKESRENTDNQVPFLGSIPILGYLFKSRSTTISRSQLLIFVTPHIYYGKDAGVDPEKVLRSLEE